MAFYKQSTAYTRSFKMIDSADHFTKKTGLTCTVNISKAGAAFGAAAGTVTEIANGWYKVALTTADTGTVGDLSFYITATGADDTDFADQVWARDLADLAFPTVSGRSMDVTATGEVGIDWANIGAPTTTVALTGTTIATTQKVDIETIKTNPVVNGGTITFPTTATLASTTNITAGTVTTATNVTTVNGLAANVITAASMAADAGAEIATAVWTDTTAGDFTVAASVGKSVMNGVALGTGLTVAAVSGAVGSVTGAVGSVTGNVGGNVTGSVGSVVGAVGSVTGNVGGNVTGSVGSVAAGGIAAASFAAGAIDATAIAANAIGASELAADAVQEIWDAATTNLTTVGSIGKLLVTDLDATVSSRLASASISLSGGAVTVGTNNDKTGYRLSATGVDDILDDALTELSAVPAAAPSLRAAMQFLYQALRNKTTTTATTQTIADSGNTTIASATLADDGTTFSKTAFT